MLLSFKTGRIHLLLARSLGKLWVFLQGAVTSSHETTGARLPLQTGIPVYVCLHVIIEGTVSYWKIWKHCVRKTFNNTRGSRTFCKTTVHIWFDWN